MEFFMIFSRMREYNKMIQHNNTGQQSYLVVAELNSVSLSNTNNKSALEKPDSVDVSDFKQAMSDDSENPNGSDSSLSGEQIEKILMMLIKLLTMLIGGKLDDETSGDTDSTSNPAKVQDGKIVNENKVAAGDGQIPKPSEHLQDFNLGGKQVTLGGDGSASASEVGQTKDTLTDLYANSTSFKNMLDSSPNDSFEVSVGRKNDDMSWANADGRVFMNINDITLGSNDSFQALTAHEFAHAGVDQQHGEAMKQFEQKVAQEA